MACYDGFGNLADGKHPIWIGDFSGNGRADVLFFYYDDKNWWLGSYQTGQITWSFAGNTAGFGNSPEGCPMWIGNFSRADRAEVLFYYPGDGNWWLGTHDGSRLNWTFAGNTSGYQPPAPPMAPECEAIANRIESLNAEIDDLQAELQNAAPGQKAGLASAIKALQQRISTQQRALNDCFLRHPRPSLPAYPNFGNLADGRPFWIGNFSRADRAEVLFYYPGDGNWWLGTHDGSRLNWTFAGNTNGFGQVGDGRPFWIGNFSRADRAEVLFYYPGDGNWWLGTHDGSRLNWTFAGNIGKPLPHKSRIYLHIKVVATTAQSFIDSQIAGISEVFDTAGVRVEIGSIEDLTVDPNLDGLRDVNVVDCQSNIWPWPSTSPDQNSLFQNRNFVGQDEIVVYIVRALTGSAPPGFVFGGCATHPPGRPGCIISRNNPRWVMAHEVGHVLGLGHVNNTDRLMNPNTSWTNTPPDLDQSEANWMDGSSLTKTC